MDTPMMDCLTAQLGASLVALRMKHWLSLSQETLQGSPRGPRRGCDAGVLAASRGSPDNQPMRTEA